MNVMYVLPKDVVFRLPVYSVSTIIISMFLDFPNVDFIDVTGNGISHLHLDEIKFLGKLKSLYMMNNPLNRISDLRGIDRDNSDGIDVDLR